MPLGPRKMKYYCDSVSYNRRGKQSSCDLRVRILTDYHSQKRRQPRKKLLPCHFIDAPPFHKSCSEIHVCIHGQNHIGSQSDIGLYAYKDQDINAVPLAFKAAPGALR